MWQRDQVVSISARDGRFELDFQPCKVNLTHTLGTPSGHSQTTVDLPFRLVERGDGELKLAGVRAGGGSVLEVWGGELARE